MQNEVARVRHRYRTILNTDFPVESICTREGPRRWRVTFYLCNGIPNSAIDYPTKRQALAVLRGAYAADHEEVRDATATPA